MALYGSIPFLLAHGRSGHTAGASECVGGGGRARSACWLSHARPSAAVYWNNPTETYIDIVKGPKAGRAGGVGSRWLSESGVWDLSLVPGPTGKDAISQFTALVGTQALPPLFALGYHQCRWNYRDEPDVYAVDAKFEVRPAALPLPPPARHLCPPPPAPLLQEHAFPYDVLWLDIEHTDGKRYFTWDKTLFPTPEAMQDKLNARGHKMVTIIDPHIKRDAGYRIHSEASEKGLYVQKSGGGGEYEGWCWPGSSSYLDFTSPKARGGGLGGG